MAVAVPPVTGSVLITCEYDEATGLEYCILHDNPVLAWLVDETGAVLPTPVILGSLAPAPPDTAPVISPPWAVMEGNMIFVPDTVRGSLDELLSWLAMNNGARRKIYANFAETSLAYGFKQWATINPTLALSEPPH